MVIRTALLCVPTFDEEAIQAIRQLLQARLPLAMVIQVDQVSGQRNLIEERLRRWCDEDEIDLVLTIGGTLPAPGHSRHELTPEATQAVSERTLPGLAELMRHHAAQESPLAWLERGMAGIRGRSLLLNLPAGAAAALLCLTPVLDLLPPLFDHLQETAAVLRLADELEIAPESSDLPAPPGPATPPSPASKAASTGASKLNAEEFAAFLRRNQRST